MGPLYSTLNSRILITRKVTLTFGKGLQDGAAWNSANNCVSEHNVWLPSPWNIKSPLDLRCDHMQA